MTKFGHVQLNRFKHLNLKIDQEQFLQSVIPFAQYIQSEIILKAEDMDDPVITNHGVFSSILAGQMVVLSDWGTAPEAQDRLREMADGKETWVHGNNLARLEADEWWLKYCDVIKLGDKIYKSYKDWSCFAIDWSDLYSWRTEMEEILKCSKVKTQLKLLSSRQPQPDDHYDKVLEVIINFKLWEFD